MRRSPRLASGATSRTKRHFAPFFLSFSMHGAAISGHNSNAEVRNGRAKTGIGSHQGSGISRPKIGVGSHPGSASVGGQIVICLVRLYGSPTVVVWSKGMYGGRAKTVRGAGEVSRKTVLWVCRCRETAAGSAGIPGSRAKVCAGCVMLVRSRKVAYRYVMIGVGCSVDHYGPLPCLCSIVDKPPTAALFLRSLACVHPSTRRGATLEPPCIWGLLNDLTSSILVRGRTDFLP